MGGAFIAPATLVDDWQRRTLQPSLPDTDRIQTFAICPRYMLGPDVEVGQNGGGIG